MAKRPLLEPLGAHLIASPGLQDAPVFDLMSVILCSHWQRARVWV